MSKRSFDDGESAVGGGGSGEPGSSSVVSGAIGDGGSGGESATKRARLSGDGEDELVSGTAGENAAVCDEDLLLEEEVGAGAGAEGLGADIDDEDEELLLAEIDAEVKKTEAREKNENGVEAIDAPAPAPAAASPPQSVEEKSESAVVEATESSEKATKEGTSLSNGFGSSSALKGSASGWPSSSSGGASLFSSSTTSHFANFKGEAAVTFGGLSSNASDSIFGKTGAGDTAENAATTSVFGGKTAVFGEKKAEKKVVVEDVPTGEENEITIHQARGKLFVLSQSDSDGASAGSWKEQGVGNIKINTPFSSNKKNKGDSSAVATTKPRLVMRREGVLKLILNTSLWSKMPMETTGDRMLRFSGKVDDGSTQSYLVKFSRKDERNEFVQKLEKVRSGLSSDTPDSSAADGAAAAV